MIKKVYVFDKDMAIREMLWMIFKRRGYLVYCYPGPGACPETFFAQLDCASGHACGKFIIASLDFPDLPRFELIKNLINKKHCKIKHIALMSTSWSDTDLETARDLGCATFQKPFPPIEMNIWIDACEEEDIRPGKDKISEHVALKH